MKEKEQTIDLLELFHVLLGRIWILIASTIVGALIFGLISVFVIAPKYESTSMIYILSASDSFNISLSDLQAGSNIAGDYQEMIYSRPVLEKVVENLGLDMGYKGLSGLISVTNKDNTRMLRITVTYTDPTIAMQIANEVAKVAKQQIAEVMQVEEPQIVETAIIPESKSSPSHSKNAIIGALLGFVIAAAIVIIRHLIDNTIANADDVEKYLELNTLAAIPLEGGMDDGTVKKKKKRFIGVDNRKKA